MFVIWICDACDPAADSGWIISVWSPVSWHGRFPRQGMPKPFVLIEHLSSVVPVCEASTFCLSPPFKDCLCLHISSPFRSPNLLLLTLMEMSYGLGFRSFKVAGLGFMLKCCMLMQVGRRKTRRLTKAIQLTNIVMIVSYYLILK